VLLVSTVQEDDSILVKALGQIGWLNRHQALLVRLFSKHGVESTQCARVVLVAPAFSSIMQEAVVSAGLDIELYQFHALEFERHQTLLLDSVGGGRRRAVQSAAFIPAMPPDPSLGIALTEAERKFFEDASPKNPPA
jgi:hypothetical protein